MEETFICEDLTGTTANVELIEEENDKGEKRIAFQGIFSEANKVNGNRRIYSEKVLKEALSSALTESKRTGQKIFGEMEHSNTAKPNLDRICCLFEDLHWDENRKAIVGKCYPTSNDAGRNMAALAKDGFKINFSTRSSGKLKPYTGPLAEGMQNVMEVCDGLKIISIDWVGTPSCDSARAETVYEEKQILEEVEKTNFKKVFDSIF